MSKILPIFIIFFFYSLTAWAYFDPGFGGYLVNSIISLIVTAFAFLSATVIYFFRTIIGKRILNFWQKYQKLFPVIFLYILNLSCAALGALLYHSFAKSFLTMSAWLDFGPFSDLYTRSFSIFLFIISFTIILAALLYFFSPMIYQRCILFFQKNRRIHEITIICILCIINTIAGAFLYHTFYKSPFGSLSLSKVRILNIDPQYIFKGYNFYEGKLFDNLGNVIKRWPYSYLGVIDKNGDFYGTRDINGNSHNPASWGRYTWNDKVIWQKNFPIHHEIYLSPKGTVFTFIQEKHHYNNYKVDFDTILEFDKNGNQLQRYSFWEHLKEFQPYHARYTIDTSSSCIFYPLIFQWKRIFSDQKGSSYDYFHLNYISMLPPNPLEAQNPAFRSGNWLISLFHGSMVFILDQDTKKIIWHMAGKDIEGSLEGQHTVSMLPNGNILLFENGFDRKSSRILIIDPLTLKIKWEYKNKGLFSPWAGSVQALPNNNFLITESGKGHVLELTQDKKIVWEYYKEDEIYSMSRYPKKMIEEILQKNQSHDYP